MTGYEDIKDYLDFECPLRLLHDIKVVVKKYIEQHPEFNKQLMFYWNEIKCNWHFDLVVLALAFWSNKCEIELETDSDYRELIEDIKGELNG